MSTRVYKKKETSKRKRKREEIGVEEKSLKEGGEEGEQREKIEVSERT